MALQQQAGELSRLRRLRQAEVDPAALRRALDSPASVSNFRCRLMRGWLWPRMRVRSLTVSSTGRQQQACAAASAPPPPSGLPSRDCQSHSLLKSSQRRHIKISLCVKQKSGLRMSLCAVALACRMVRHPSGGAIGWRWSLGEIHELSSSRQDPRFIRAELLRNWGTYVANRRALLFTGDRTRARIACFIGFQF